MRLTALARRRLEEIRSYSNNLRITLFHNSTAYGYSILITGTFVIIARLEGAPQVYEVFLAAAGAIISFAAIEAVSTRGFRERGRGEHPETVMLGSTMRFFSTGLGLAAATLSAYVFNGWLTWVLAPFLATTAYIFLEATELMMASRIKEKDQ